MKLSSLLLFSILLFSCSKDHDNSQIEIPVDCSTGHFTFEKDILPIFTSNCNFRECHVSGGEGSYDFRLYPVVVDRIRAGTMEYRLALPLDDPQHMPEKMRLSDCDYYIIKSWISQGYPEN